MWHSNTKYATTIWQCNNKFQKRKFCSTPHLKEEIIKKAFVEAFNSLIENKDDILQSYEEIIEKISDFSKQEKECSEIDRQCEVIENQLQRLIAENVRSAMDQREYDERYNGFVFEYNSFEKRRNELSSEITKINGRKNLMEAFMKELRDRKELLEEFDEGLWSATLNAAVIKSDTEIIFKLKDGTEIPWELNQEKI